MKEQTLQKTNRFNTPINFQKEAYRLLQCESGSDYFPRLDRELGENNLYLEDFSLPRADFGLLLKEQEESAKVLRSRELPKPTFSEQFLDWIESAWAPERRDLPDKRSPELAGNSALPFRREIIDSQDLKNRRSLLKLIRQEEVRHRITPWSTVFEYEVPIRNLPIELDGFKILHLSDIHFLRTNDRSVNELRAFADWLDVREKKLDVALLSGDTITVGPDDLLSYAPRKELTRVTEHCAESFSVYGNHDYHGHVPALISRELESCGFHDINNHRVRLSINGKALNIFGVDDAYFGSPKAPENIRKDEVNIVLTHNLDAIRGNFPAEIDLILSGHTHWGELKLFDGSWLMNKWGYCDDLNQHTRHWDMLSSRTASFVHPGLARYYVPYRGLRHPPGFVIHTLRSL